MLRSLRRGVAATRESRRLSATARAVRRRGLTYLQPERLVALERACREVNERRIPGDFVEAGVALGGTAILLATHMGPDRRFHGYDVFGMIPPPGDSDDAKSHERYAVIASGRSVGIDGGTYYGYIPDLYDRVVANFEQFGLAVGDRVLLHEGLFEETLHPSAPVALAHVDSDWFEPVATCLARLAPRMSPGGAILVDDYNDYRGCRRAVDEFLSTTSAFRLEDRSSNALLRRTG
jgi:O-methyltransferase